ncbi:MAG: sulfatase-like hydrolase/transferase [Proteobacteria bacterium]|nr:sulfatase-like hydrolase/transferase [Pseudomonadota bacterium]
MTRTWLFRILRGTAAGLLLGAIVGGFEVAIALRSSITEVVNAMERLQLWAINASQLGLVGACAGLVLSALIGAFAGQNDEVATLAFETERDPRYPWLPWVLGGVFGVALLIQVVPRAEAMGGGGRTAMLYALVAIGAGICALGLRLWLKRVDETGKGTGLALLGLPTLLVLSSSFAVSADQAGGKGEPIAEREGVPNVLVISVDGLRVDHIGERVRTPTLRHLSKKGVVFSQAVTMSTADGPSAAALMTGRHPLATGFIADGQSLPDRVPGSGKVLETLAGEFAEEGYVTGAFVSSAALDGGATGLDRGFGVYDDGVGVHRPGIKPLALPTLRRWASTSGGRTPNGYQVLRPSAETLLRFEYWLAWHYRENLFSWVHLADPRMPFLGADVGAVDLLDPLPGDSGRAHSSRVVQLDAILGELFEALEEDKLLERTLVVIVGTRGYVPDGMPTIDEPWVHVPLIMYGAGLEGGVVVDRQVRLIDLPATILSAAGFRRARMGDGTSLVPMLEGRAVPDSPAISVAPPRADGRCAVSVRTPETKYTRDGGGKAGWYLLPDDPRELRNRIDDYREEATKAGDGLSDLLGREVPLASIPPADPGRAADLRALKANR